MTQPTFCMGTNTPTNLSHTGSLYLASMGVWQRSMVTTSRETSITNCTWHDGLNIKWLAVWQLIAWLPHAAHKSIASSSLLSCIAPQSYKQKKTGDMTTSTHGQETLQANMKYPARSLFFPYYRRQDKYCTGTMAYTCGGYKFLERRFQKE